MLVLYFVSIILSFNLKLINLWLRQVDDRQFTGDTPLYQPYRSVCAAPKGRVFAPFWSENGYGRSSFWSGIGYGF